MSESYVDKILCPECKVANGHMMNCSLRGSWKPSCSWCGNKNHNASNCPMRPVP